MGKHDLGNVDIITCDYTKQYDGFIVQSAAVFSLFHMTLYGEQSTKISAVSLLYTLRDSGFNRNFGGDVHIA